MIHVVAACILNNNQQILLGKRSQEQNLAGFWEFPGGKIEQGENPIQALKRELKEELALDCVHFYHLFEHKYRYDFGMVELSFFATLLSPEQYPTCIVHEKIEFVATEDIHTFNLLPANKAILADLLLELNKMKDQL